jgi:hypothetical protein
MVPYVLTIGVLFPLQTILRYIASSKQSSSSAHYSPLLDIGHCNLSPSRSILGYSHPAPASYSAQIVTPSAWGRQTFVYRDAVSTQELVYLSGCRFYGWYGQPTATSACEYRETPSIALSIARWASLNLWTSRAVSVHVSAPYATNSLEWSLSR